MFKKYFLISISAVFLSLLTHTAQAVIIDNNTYTSDTATKLDWLDVTASAGRSYTDVLSNLGAGGDFSGWRFATTGELDTLLDNFGGVGSYLGSNTAHEGVADLFVQYLGDTFDYSNDIGLGYDFTDPYYGYTFGYWYDPASFFIRTAFIADHDKNIDLIPGDDLVDTIDTNYSVFFPTSYSLQIGSFLVRTTPEPAPIPAPATLPLFVLGVSLLTLMRCRRGDTQREIS